ncbi:MAG TPA: hypothetical protein VN951_04920 [Pyrinomonadaceae bacterium]|nr:hypothetical protein [Pyrinomonadaceae bacterium]
MDNKVFDPNNIRIEDIFSAKQERRKRLASLPLEEKIKIVERLQTVSVGFENEKIVFEAFIRMCPNFASEPIKEWDTVGAWYAKRALAAPAQPFNKRPDILAVTESGKKIGVELKSWLNQQEIREAKKQDRIRKDLLTAIGEQPPNKTKHIGSVWLHEKQIRFNRRDAISFRREMFDFIEQTDAAWPHETSQSDDVKRVYDLASFPILEKYLSGVEFRSRPGFDSHWINFTTRGGAYFADEALRTLREALLAHRRDDRYNNELRIQAGLDEIYLLVHYDKALAYNTPFCGPNSGYKEAVEFAAKVLNGDAGYFDGIFLFYFVHGHEEANRIL